MTKPNTHSSNITCEEEITELQIWAPGVDFPLNQIALIKSELQLVLLLDLIQIF